MAVPKKKKYRAWKKHKLNIKFNFLKKFINFNCKNTLVNAECNLIKIFVI
jgi:hypothetical protein